ncbi:MAG: alpha-hydroxy acid oxidase [Vicinamibacterales bacterium]
MRRVDACVNIADLRRLAKRRVPRAVFDYLDGGSDDEVTLGENCRAFDDLYLRPRSGVALPTVDLSTTLLGQPLPLPIVLAPLGSGRLFYPRGEAVAARSAGDAGLTYTLSTLAGTAIEEVTQATRGPVFYQLYLVGGRDVASEAMARATAAGCTALMVTIDTAVAGNRERDLRNGMKALLTGTMLQKLPFLPDILGHPKWLFGFFADGGLMAFPNVMLPGVGPMPYASVSAALAQSVVTWDDFSWIRKVWRGPIIVKGVHTANDARRAVDEGAAAVVVSNHGGRQLDGVAATIRVLPEVVDAVGERVDVLMDGGIRRGSDIAKAVALGAKAVLIGRAYGYGLAAAGGAGVSRAIDILRTDLVRTLTLLGCASIGQLDRTYVSSR